MKTLITKISSESNSQNYDINGKENGHTATVNYRILVEEDNTEVGNVSVSVSSNYYSNQPDEEYSEAKSAFEAKLKSAIETLFKSGLYV